MITEVLLMTITPNIPQPPSTAIFQALLNSDIGKKSRIASDEQSLTIFGPDHNPTKITDFSIIKIDDVKTFNSAHIYGICCDLSRENLSLEGNSGGTLIEERINELRAKHPSKPFILIGTKAEASILDNLESLQKLANSTGINDVFLTSSDNIAQINDLFLALPRLSLPIDVIFSSILKKQTKIVY